MDARVRLVAAIALLALALSVSGCSMIAEKAAKTAVEKTTGVSVDEKDGTVKFEKDGESIEITDEEGELPDGLPEGFPVYEGKVDRSGKFAGNEGTSFTFAVTTEDEVADVLKWQEDELKSAGYEITASASAATDGKASGSIQFKKGEKEEGLVMMIEGEGEDDPNSISYTLVLK